MVDLSDYFDEDYFDLTLFFSKDEKEKQNELL